MRKFKRLPLLFVVLGLFLYGSATAIAEGDWENLRDATRQGDIKTMNQFINSGVDVHHRDRAGWTVLHWWNFSFNEKTHMDALRLLIKRGVNANAVDTRGRTALMLLLVPGDDQPPGPQLEAIKVLVAAGTDLRIKNEWGETAMSLGLASKFPSVRSYFKELGVVEK